MTRRPPKNLSDANNHWLACEGGSDCRTVGSLILASVTTESVTPPGNQRGTLTHYVVDWPADLKERIAFAKTRGRAAKISERKVAPHKGF